MKLAFTLVVLFVLIAPLYGQGTRADYHRSETYADRHDGLVFRDRVTPNWFGTQQDRFWYRVRTGKNGHQYVLVNASEGTRAAAFDHVALATKLSEAEGTTVNSDSLDLRSVRFDDEATELRFRFGDTPFRLDLATEALSKVSGDDDGAGQFGLPPMRRMARSRQNGPRTPIRFDNRLDQPLFIFWVMSDGHLRPYGQVAAGTTHRLSTFAGHAWLLQTADETPIACFVASQDEDHAIIDRDTPGPTSNDRRNRAEGRGMSADEQWKVEIENNNVKLIETATQRETILTSDGTEKDGYDDRIWWAPDSSAFVVMRTKRGTDRQVHIVESSPPRSVHPRLISFGYAKPGDDVDHPNPALFSKQDGWKPRPIDDSLFPNPYALNDLAWHDNSESFSFLFNPRGHQSLRLIQVDARNSQPRVLIDETSDTFVCYSQKSYLLRLDESDEAIWMSERSGWNHLYLIDTKTGQVKNPITSGDWVVRDVERVDPESRQIWLSVSGIDADQDPYYLHLIRVNFDGSDMVRLTEGDGTHRWRFSPDQRYLLDNYSRVDLPPVTVLRRADDGRRITELERGEINSLRQTGWQPPQRFVAKGRDGETDIYGIIVRPTNFQSGKKYPVIEEIYAGPHSAFVPKSFGLHDRLYEMAELGFIIVKIDGMGTSHRSKAFHDVCWQNLGDSGFPDRIAWIEAAAAKHPEMDLTRVGIYGGSAGGQSAMRALIAHGDFYHSAVADCGCHDNRVDKIWWNEQWMGWPIGPHYEQQSNATQAHRLRGDLMLIWGELDRNVDPASTMQVVDALVKADKDFEQLIVPGQGHGAAGHPYAKRRQADFFVRKLWRRQPRSE